MPEHCWHIAIIMVFVLVFVPLSKEITRHLVDKQQENALAKTNKKEKKNEPISIKGNH